MLSLVVPDIEILERFRDLGQLKDPCYVGRNTTGELLGKGRLYGNELPSDPVLLS